MQLKSTQHNQHINLTQLKPTHISNLQPNTTQINPANVA